jgi:hypothetical protein
MWLYEDKVVEEVPPDMFGFVYLIECTENGKAYIGRKYFTKAGYKVVKGKRKKLRKESDWESYYGSSKDLLADLELYGEESFKRTILRYCQTRGETNYQEAKLQFQYNVLEEKMFDGTPKYYNSWISGKFHRASISKKA